MIPLQKCCQMTGGFTEAMFLNLLQNECLPAVLPSLPNSTCKWSFYQPSR